MNPDGTGQTNLTNDGILGGNDYPAWSPDSSQDSLPASSQQRHD
jgi:Tol biopolymer transport system component